MTERKTVLVEVRPGDGSKHVDAWRVKVAIEGAVREVLQQDSWRKVHVYQPQAGDLEALELGALLDLPADERVRFARKGVCVFVNYDSGSELDLIRGLDKLKNKKYLGSGTTWAFEQQNPVQNVLLELVSTIRAEISDFACRCRP